MRAPYKTVSAPGHHLVWGTERQQVLEHRFVLFEKLGSGRHSCHWCGVTVMWIRMREAPPSGVKRIVVGRLDNDLSNNDESNLVPSCAACSGLRLRREDTPKPKRSRKTPSTAGLGKILPEGGALRSDQVGPYRSVVSSRSGVRSPGLYTWLYTLSCGHVVERRGSERTRCACGECRV